MALKNQDVSARATLRPATILDVATRAGVSTATVSRALATPEMVSPKTRARVVEAVGETGYTPNVAARNLRARKSMVVLVVVPNLANPVFPDVIRGIDDELVGAGYDMIVGNLDNLAEREARYVDLCIGGQVDGVLLMTGHVPRGADRSVSETGLPMAAMCAAIPELDGPSIVVDDYRSSARVAEYLHRLGHRRFGYAEGPAENINQINRMAGYLDGLKRMGADPEIVRIWPGQFDMQSGVSVGTAFLEVSRAERPTAMFLACDALAIGFMKTVMAAGLRVPDDVSVVGFDGIEYAEFYQPSLTTIRQPRHEIGRLAAELLLRRLHGSGADAVTGVVEVEAEFLEGQSSGPPPAHGGLPPAPGGLPPA